MRKWFMIIDIEKCENCNNCFLACKDEHVGNDWPGYSSSQPEHSHKWMQLHTRERGTYPLIDVAYLRQPCLHCDDAPCIDAANNGAVYKRADGIVIIDPVKAKGQRNLVSACPYNAIWWNEELAIAQKCTFCAHLLDKGWDKPRCVQSCPTGALSMHHLDDREMQKVIAAEKLQAYQPQLHSNTHVFYRNLYRYARCFIAGSVAVTEAGKEECAAGANVTLLDAMGNKIGETVTDVFGDFKFDDLPPDSGRYSLNIAYKTCAPKTQSVELRQSVSIGSVLLQ